MQKQREMSDGGDQMAFVAGANVGRLPLRQGGQATRRSGYVCKAEMKREGSGATPSAAAPVSTKKRQPWPVGRFLRDFLFFTPLGKMLSTSTSSSPSPARTAGGEKRVVFVSGATGGLGKRVVRELVRQGRYRVRILVRSEERARELLGEETFKSVEVFVSDLYNLSDDFFRDDVAAVISCTGTKVGRPDDLDRSKYYAMLGDTPENMRYVGVLEDTPENVEYVGVRNLAAKAGQFVRTTETIMEFKDEEATRTAWGVVDDVVMGGVSESALLVSPDGTGVFQGTVSTSNSGGFVSVRTRPFSEPLAVNPAATAFVLWVKGDGNRYKFIARTDSKWDGVGYGASFDTVKDDWMEVEIPFRDLKAFFRAKTLPDDKFDPTAIRSFQVMLSKFEYDGELNPKFQEGFFRLEMESIRVRTDAPKFIHVSSAGVTRVLRKEDYPTLESEPPAVRMNAALGRILEWKLAGEDAVRQAGVPYLILRPTGLSEDEARGKVGFGQGDRLKGRVPREDVAAVIVDTLENGTASNLTLEVTGEGDISEYGKALAMYQKDNEEERLFAPFPFVPE